MNKKEKKYLTILFILLFIMLITMASGIMFVYYNNKNNADTSVKVVFKNISLLISYEQSNKIIFNGVDNGLDYNYSFDITNSSIDYSVGYKLSFNIESPLSSEEINNFTYSLSGETKNKNATDKLIKINNGNVPVKDLILGEGRISPDQIHYYKLNIKYNGEKSNSIFKGVVSLEKAID